MESKRIIVHLDPYIIDILNEFINTYTNQPRGRIISIVVSLFLKQNKQVQKEYLKKSKDFVKNSTKVTPGIKYGDISKGKQSVNLFVSGYLYERLNIDEKKYLVIAAMMFVGLITDKED